MASGTKTTLVNWSGNRIANDCDVYAPSTVDDVVSIVKKSRGEGRKIRAVGTNMSPNGAAISDGATCISMTNFNRLQSVDKETGVATVQPGMRIGDLLNRLAEYGLTLSNVPAVTEMTIGGATQTGSHGSAVGSPPLNEACVALKFVTAEGEVVDLSEAADGQRFHEAKCALGTFGIVVELKLKCDPLTHLREEVTVVKLADVQRGHSERLAASKHLMYGYYISLHRVRGHHSAHGGREGGGRCHQRCIRGRGQQD